MLPSVTILCEGGLVRAVYDTTGQEITCDVFDADDLRPDFPLPGEVEGRRHEWLERAEALPNGAARRNILSWLAE